MTEKWQVKKLSPFSLKFMSFVELDSVLIYLENYLMTSKESMGHLVCLLACIGTNILIFRYGNFNTLLFNVCKCFCWY